MVDITRASSEAAIKTSGFMLMMLKLVIQKWLRMSTCTQSGATSIQVAPTSIGPVLQQDPFMLLYELQGKGLWVSL